MNVLLVEDAPSDAKLVVRELERGGYAVSSLRVETADALRAALAGREWDLVISDWRMPELDAREALAIVLAHDPDMPFIIVSGTVGEDIAVDAMRAGARDF